MTVQEGDINHGVFSETNQHNSSLMSSTLDKLYENNTINNIGFIHLDVEGMEYKIISGANKLIEKELPIITYEGHIESDKYLNDIKLYLTNLQYKIYLIEEVCGLRGDCRNFLAIPDNKDININNIIKNTNIGNDILKQI